MPPPKKTAATRPTRKPKNKAPAEPKLSRSRPPEDMSAVEWQIRLRRQFGREQSFVLENIGEEQVFSDFFVTNPDSGSRYRVAIRGVMTGVNFCSCPDFATNGLGTCKHIEFTLARIEARRGGKTALKGGLSSVLWRNLFALWRGAQPALSRGSGLSAGTRPKCRETVRPASRRRLARGAVVQAG